MSKPLLDIGEVAVVITPSANDESFTAFAHFKPGQIDPQDPDAVSTALYYNLLARGMAYLATTDQDLVIEAGTEHMRQEIAREQHV